jgi:hypothetical protein
MGRPKVIRPDFVIPEPGWAQLGYWCRKSTAKSFVYIVEAQGDSPIKIGVANDVVKRIATLQTGNPRRLCLLHALVGDRRFEQHLHRLFSDIYGHRLVGEWFVGAGTSDFLDMVEDLAHEMLLRHKNGTVLPDYRDFSPFKERLVPSNYVDWTDKRRAEREAAQAA